MTKSDGIKSSRISLWFSLAWELKKVVVCEPAEPQLPCNGAFGD